MKKVARRHGLVCLLHEKPFAGINGSGKHLTWSLTDDKGGNLLNPGDTPEANLQFLTVLVSVIHAVYYHADLLRASVATAGNEHRLGANEAPPAIMSVFLGEQLFEILDQIEKGKIKKAKKLDAIDLGVGLLPRFKRDTSDRNRTSPFAFTGQKFEFRALGSSLNISTAIAVLNTIVSDSMNQMASLIRTELKKQGNFESAVLTVLSKLIKDIRPILFEGNNYSQEWMEEAARRGLPNEPSTPEALKALVNPDNIGLFERLGVFSKVEMVARYHIWTEMYQKVIEIEARTLSEMVSTQVLPPAYGFQGEVANSLDMLMDYSGDKTIGIPEGAVADRRELLIDLTSDILNIRKNLKEMTDLLRKSESLDLAEKCRVYYCELKPNLACIRKHVDDLESKMPDEVWPLPKYKEMLFIC
jgi:glutamine synthetase